jgi:hypothetical protein
MRGLKALVAIMTLLIVAAMGLLIYGFTAGIGNLMPDKPFAPLTLPAGAQIRLMGGYDGGLAILVEHNGTGSILLYDVKSRASAGEIPIKSTD